MWISLLLDSFVHTFPTYGSTALSMQHDHDIIRGTYLLGLVGWDSPPHRIQLLTVHNEENGGKWGNNASPLRSDLPILKGVGSRGARGVATPLRLVNVKTFQVG